MAEPFDTLRKLRETLCKESNPINTFPHRNDFHYGVIEGYGRAIANIDRILYKEPNCDTCPYHKRESKIITVSIDLNKAQKGEKCVTSTLTEK